MNPGTKKPQLPEDHAQVMASATEHGMEGVAQAAVEPVTGQQPVVFHLTDHRLDGAASFDVLLPRRVPLRQTWTLGTAVPW